MGLDIDMKFHQEVMEIVSYDTKYFKMSHSKTKFNNSWLKKKDSNGNLLEWWCKSHDSSKLCANYVTRKFKLQTMVVLLLCNMQNRTCISKKQ